MDIVEVSRFSAAKICAVSSVHEVFSSQTVCKVSVYKVSGHAKRQARGVTKHRTGPKYIDILH